MVATLVYKILRLWSLMIIFLRFRWFVVGLSIYDLITGYAKG